MHLLRTSQKYNVSLILDENLIFDQAKYEAYSPLFLSTTFALCYAISFATVTSVVVHTYLYHGTEIVQRYKMARNQEDDIHMRLMKKYRDAPDWWYLAMFLAMVSKPMRTGLARPLIFH
jgi:OPT oligopeptide transporter protein